MSMRRHLLTPDTFRTLRSLAEHGNPEALRAARLWDERRHARKGSAERRFLTRAFERAAGRALEGKEGE